KTPFFRRPAVVAVAGAVVIAVVAAGAAGAFSGGSPFPNGSEKKLLQIVPAAAQQSCRRSRGAKGNGPAARRARFAADEAREARAKIYCRIPGLTAYVSYFLFSNRNQLDRWYFDRIWDATPVPKPTDAARPCSPPQSEYVGPRLDGGHGK